ncbi:MAG: 16S rRNA (cytosine(1402)-N(4))-methyltransferase RsmH [Candidatus Komeilibacteria bacterium]|nr:16S rRNA (cytosine(1402)-N(4))-methyltransferase RsmH [Candidatus Komeilibacteria bacterium]
MKYFHQPVLLEEVIEYLNPKANQNFIDCTIGGGGHARAILEKIKPNGKLLGLDRDPKAIAATGENLKIYKNRLILINDSYKNIQEIIYGNKIDLQFNGILLDLGLSSAQISAEDERGFSFQADQPLDMRFGPDGSLTAAEILNKWPEQKLLEIFKNYGEEPRARMAAQKIVKQRAVKEFTTTLDLVELMDEVYGGGRGKLNPATKVFQALRIAVNNELENLSAALPKLLQILSRGGRMAVISYHSLEDRIVKHWFQDLTKDCICPKNFPECRCDHRQQADILTKKSIQPASAEIKANPRSRSARLRVMQKI